MLLYLFLLVLCLAFSAFFSASEAAFLSLQRLRLHRLLQRKVPGARLVARLAERPERLLPTILLGNNLVNTAAASLGTALALIFFSQKTAVVVATVGVTMLLLVVGETAPKLVAIRRAEAVALVNARALELLRRLFFPVATVLQWIGQMIARPFGSADTREMATEEEIKVLISAGRAAGTMDHREAQLLENVFRFGDRQVREVMVPRTEVVWVARGTPLREFLKLYAGHPFSRFPVYEGGADNVVGILAVTDVLRGLAENRLGPDHDVTALARQAWFTPETKPIADLLREMRQLRSPIAVVVDEFGGVAGVVTLTMLVEEVVGSVADEGAVEGEEWVALDENTFEVDGGMRVEEANTHLSLGIPEGDYETVAGFVLEALGRIPKQGEHLHHGGLRIAVSKMRGVRIEKLRITRVPVAPPNAVETP